MTFRFAGFQHSNFQHDTGFGHGGMHGFGHGMNGGGHHGGGHSWGAKQWGNHGWGTKGGGTKGGGTKGWGTKGSGTKGGGTKGWGTNGSGTKGNGTKGWGDHSWGGSKGWGGTKGCGWASSTNSYHNGGVEGGSFADWYDAHLAPHYCDDKQDHHGTKGSGSGGTKGSVCDPTTDDGAEKTTLTYTLGTDPQVTIEVTETPTGTLFFDVQGASVDVNGLFFNMTDDDDVSSLIFFPESNQGSQWSPVTGSQADANSVSTLADGSSVPGQFDGAVQFGTVNDSTDGEVSSVNFTLSSADGPLTFDDIDLDGMTLLVDTDSASGQVLTVTEGPDDDADDAEALAASAPVDAAPDETGGEDLIVLDLSNEGAFRIVDQETDPDDGTLSGTVEFLDGDGAVFETSHFDGVNELQLPEPPADEDDSSEPEDDILALLTQPAEESEDSEDAETSEDEDDQWMVF